MKLLQYCEEHLSYNAETGALCWKKAPKWVTNITLNQTIENYDRGGYRRICVQGKSYKAHIICWLMAHGRLPTKMIDHIDRNPANNSITNLREVTRSENGRNTDRIASGLLTGAYPHGQQWVSRIRYNKKLIYIGLFKTQEEAHAAYLCKSQSLTQ